MKSTLKYALTAAMGFALVMPALSQDNFPDSPENHWAYEALANMKREGILVGYPDGLFRGGRPALRYELAVAINAAYQKIMSSVNGLSDQVKSLNEKIEGGSGQGLQELRDQLNSLQNDLNAMKAWGDDIANLRRLADTFQKELASLGVDVESMKKDLADLEDRVSKLEARRPAVDISGDANLLSLMGHSSEGDFGLTPDRRLTGVGKGDYAGVPVGLTKDFSLFHEVAVTFKGTNESGPQWQATMVAGNMFGPLGSGGSTSLGNYSYLPSDPTGFAEGSSDVYLHDFSVNFDTSVAGVSFGAEIGRIGYQISPYLFQRNDFTTYFANDRWDNGEWIFDGALLKFNFGGAKLHVFGGRNSERNSVNGIPVNNIGFLLNDNSVGAPVIDQSLGIRLNVPISDMGSVNLAYLWLDTNDVTLINGVKSNRNNVFGGDVNLKFGKIDVTGGFSQSNFSYNTSNVLDDQNQAWFASGGYTGSNWGVNVGYRKIEPFFSAPGAWQRIGTEWNPTDIESWNVGAYISPTTDLKLSGWFEQGHGTTAATNDDDFRTWTARLDYRFQNGWSLMASYEDVRFEPAFNVNDPQQRWVTVGLGYALGPNSKLDIRYQSSDLKNSTILGFPTDRFRGGLLSTQLTVKF